MEDIHSSPISTFSVGKARKKNGCYMCPIYSNKKHPFYVNVNGATIVGIKDIGSTLVLKCKSALSYIDELTSVLLKVVELNHTEWFNSSIDETFIEEYFTSPIHYDNKNGVVIRLKLKNIEDIEHVHVQHKVNITFVLKNITFLRQKFYPVFEVHSLSVLDGNEFVEEVDETCTDGVEDEEVVPSFDEVLAMKNDTMTKLHNDANILRKTIEDANERLRHLTNSISKLESSKTIRDILSCCEQIQEDC